MSTTPTVAPEVRLFLARVQRELADLDPDEVREMTDGLEADLSELVADRGASALGSPADYAAELRASAGLAPRGDGERTRLAGRIDELLDGVRAGFDRAVGGLPSEARELLAWLRPLWWVVRAWAAVSVVWLVLAGSTLGLVPGPPLVGPASLLVAILGSVLVGRGTWWPGRGRGGARVVLLLLNAFAVVVTPYLLSRPSMSSYSAVFASDDPSIASPAVGSGLYDPSEQAGVYSGGHWVSNIYAYDASGKPLTGVQLFDQSGRPISVVRGPECPDGGGAGTWSVIPGPPEPSQTCADMANGGQARVSYPWTNGAAQLDNVYPLPTRLQDDFATDPNAFTSATPPAIGPFPMASAPVVSLPGITPSVQQVPAPPTPSKPRKK